MGRWWTDDLPYPFNDIADGFRETGHDRRARKANEDWTYFRMIKWIGKNNGCETEEVFTQIYPETTSLFYMVTDEQKERFQGLLMRLREEGWLREEKREEQQSAWFYLTGEGDERWDEKIWKRSG